VGQMATTGCYLWRMDFSFNICDSGTFFRGRLRKKKKG